MKDILNVYNLFSQGRKIVVKTMAGMYAGNFLRDPLADRNNSKALGFDSQVEMEHRPWIEQELLVFQANVTGRPVNIQPMNPHTLLYLSAQPDRKKVIQNASGSPMVQSWADIAANISAGRGLLRK